MAVWRRGQSIRHYSWSIPTPSTAEMDREGGGATGTRRLAVERPGEPIRMYDAWLPCRPRCQPQPRDQLARPPPCRLASCFFIPRLVRSPAGWGSRSSLT